MPESKPFQSTSIPGNRSSRNWFLHDRWIVLAALALMVVGFYRGEKVPVAHGLGWDGVTYAAQAKDLYEETIATPLDQYHVQRVLPSAVVHVGLRLCRRPLTDGNVIRGFALLNILCVTLLTWFWCRTARVLSIGAAGKWLGFCGLVLNFAVAKYASYCPVLTDIPACMLGGGMLYFYLTGQRRWLYLFTALGAFTWPTLLMQGLLLLMFPRENDPELRNVASPTRGSYLVAGLATYYFVLMMEWCLHRISGTLSSYLTPLRSVILLSIAVAAIYAFSVLVRMVDVGGLWESVKRLASSRRSHALGVLVFALAIKVVQHVWAPRPSMNHPQNYLLSVCFKATAKPAIFLLAHVVYYGPLVLVAIFLWKPVSQAIRQTGLGLALATTFALLHAVDSESRHLIYALPLIVPFVIKASEALRWNPAQYGFLFAVSALYSKVWFTINQGPFPGTNLLIFPEQYYGMNFGPFMANETYVFQGAITLAIATAIYVFCIARQSPTSASVKNELAPQQSSQSDFRLEFGEQAESVLRPA